MVGRLEYALSGGGYVATAVAHRNRSIACRAVADGQHQNLHCVNEVLERHGRFAGLATARVGQ